MPVALLPAVPTFAENGLEGYEVEIWYGFFAPAKTPDAIVRRLNAEINLALKKPVVRERFLMQGTEAMGGTPEQLTAVMKTEIERLNKIIKNTGLQ